MRTVAAGALLIAACVNLYASAGYLLGGLLMAGVSVGAGSLGSEIIGELASQQGQAGVSEFSAGIDQMAGSAMIAGGALVFFGVFLLVACGMMLAGAVFLLRGMRPKFVVAAAVVALVAEVSGILIASFSITNLVGLLAGVLALLAAKPLVADDQAELPETAAATKLEAIEDSSGGPAGRFRVPALAEGAIEGPIAHGGLDAIDKRLLAVMILGVVLMVSAGAWYWVG
ncbi:MAG: hypothetical protein ACFCVA_03585 [Gammaproteobacteria bacterium]